MFQWIKANIGHIPSTILGICLILVAAPQDAAIQKVMALSLKVANIITTSGCIAGGIAAIILIGQKTLGGGK